MQEEKNVVGGQAAPREHLDCEEIDSGQDCHMRSNEILPVCVLTALRCQCLPMTAKKVAYGLIRNNVPEVGQCSYNSIVTQPGFSRA